MRNPNNILDFNNENDKNSGILDMTNIPEYNYHDWELKDPKEFTKFIQYVEKEIRGSFEYRQYIQYLRNAFEMNRDSFYMNVSNSANNNIKIEIHHEPLTLYDIVLVVFRKRQANDEDISEEALSKEVIWCHYNNLVGLIPLSQTVHQLVHSGLIFIPATHVFGDYKMFIDIYKPFFTLDQNDTLAEIEKQTANFDENKFKELLAHKELYINDGYSLSSEDVINTLNECKSNIYSKMRRY